MKHGFYRQDISGNEYVLPEYELEMFDEGDKTLHESDPNKSTYNTLLTWFTDAFEKYKIDSIYNKKILIE